MLWFLFKRINQSTKTRLVGIITINLRGNVAIAKSEVDKQTVIVNEILANLDLEYCQFGLILCHLVRKSSGVGLSKILDCIHVYL